MTILRVEHPVKDFDRWKAAFDGQHARREGGGVRRYDLYRPVGDPNAITIDLTFDGAEEAATFRAGLEELWRTPQAAAVLGGSPRTSIFEVVERAVL